MSQEMDNFILLERAMKQKSKAEDLIQELRRRLRTWHGLSDADIDDRLAYLE